MAYIFLDDILNIVQTSSMEYRNRIDVDVIGTFFFLI